MKERYGQFILSWPVHSKQLKKEKKMKSLTWPLILLNLLMFIWVGNASSYTINDTTDVRSYAASSGTPFTWQGSQYHDVIGQPPFFEVFGINISGAFDALTFDLYTNFNDDGYYVIDFDDPAMDIHSYIADVAIEVNGDKYAVVMRDHETWTDGAEPADAEDYTIGLYSVTDSNWHASTYFFNDSYNPYSVFGGGYIVGATEYMPYVAIAEGSWVDNVVANTIAVDSGNVIEASSWLDDPDDPYLNGGDGPKYRWSFTIENVSSTLGLGAGDEIDIFWGGATCSNDAISGTTVIPEPTSLLLTGFGLIGLALIGRRKLRKK